MRVAHVIDTLNVGGAQKLLVTFADAARGTELETTVVSFTRDNNSPLPSQLSALGAKVFHFPASQLFDARRLTELVRLLRRERYDVLNTHLTYANINGIIAGTLARVPVVSTLHSAGKDPAHRRVIPHVESVLLRFGARRVIAVGYFVAQANRARLGNRHVDVIPNAVAVPAALSADERLEIRKTLMTDPSRVLLISVGRLNILKGYADLIDAFARIHENFPQTCLAIAGGGDLYDALDAQIKARGLHKDVMLLGSRNDVPRLLAASDLFVSASHLEGMPVAVLEAMAAGLAVVATDVGDVSHVVAQGTGIVVPARQPELLAQAVCALVDNPAQRQAFGAQARAHVLANYSQKVWLERLRQLYAKVKQ